MMKKSFYLLPALALALASCSSEDPITGDDNYNGPIETNYLTVNIRAAGESVTRADDNPEHNPDGETGDYENGKGKENDVNTVRFYFFDALGNSVKVSNATGTLLTYLDWNTPTEVEDFESTDNVAKQLETTLIINSEAGDKRPTSVVAIINPTDEIKSADITSIESLNDVVESFTATDQNSSFVMSNSVYVKEENNIKNKVAEIDITANIRKNADEAKANKAEIFVERVNAKVRVGIDPSLSSDAKTDGNGNIIVSTGVQNTTNTNAGDDPKIYVKLLGWNVTSTPNKSRLIKEIDPTWTNNVLFSDDVWNWSSTTRHRSFWAVNPVLNYSAENIDYDFGNFTNAYAHKLVKTDEVYVQENASQSTSATELAPAYPTKVIIGAQLVDENGKELEIAEWGTNLYTQEDLLTQLANQANIYKLTITTTGEPGEEQVIDKKWEKLDKNYFKFIGAEEAGKADFDNDGRYNSYFILNKDEVKDMKLVKANSSEDVIDVDIINNSLLSNVAPAKVWKDGKTYYYFNVQHLGSEGSPAEFGVVRNHIYDCNITSIAGLGTPVFDPDNSEDSKTIYPEKPDDNITMIAAHINVLTGRLVKSNVGISWP